jgi:hypothetical protein
MSKTKYVALLAVAVLFAAVFSVISHPIGGNMYEPDGNTHAPYQTDTPPYIDGVVNVGLTWPVESWIGHTYIAQQGGGIATTDVYLLFDDLTGYTRTDVPPAGYGPEDEQGYYFYIGIKALNGYTIHPDGNWVVIDWDLNDTIDFDDHNGNSVNRLNYSTDFAWTSTGVEWAIPYIDDYYGVCQSPFRITIHIEIVKPGNGGTETTTFPDRPPKMKGSFLSTEICVGDMFSPEPPEPGEWGIRTIGFWKHQFNTALGLNKGHQHVPTENLLFYLTEIYTQSQIPELQDMDTDMFAALAILELRGKHSMKERGIQQLLATWLNYVSGNEVWDHDGNSTTPGESIMGVILQAEAAFLDSDPTNDEYWKDYLDTLNNSGTD